MVEFILEIGQTVVCILCLLIGVRIGQKTSKGEDIVIPTPNKIITEIRENRERKAEEEMNARILENINNYNGTALGQKDL